MASPSKSALILSCAHALFYATVAAQSSPIDYVNTQIGTTNLGHVFAGATLPYGMAKAVSDTTGNNRGGFSYDGLTVSGFSHMHDSGTGGGSSMGNFPLFAYAGCKNDHPNGCAPFIKDDRAVGFNTSSVSGDPGYFSITLNTSVRGEMTVTERAALYRFTFPDQPDATNSTLKPFIISDLTDLYDSRSRGAVTVNQTTGRMMGSGNFEPGFGTGTYNSYFCADFGGASMIGSGIWQESKTSKATSLTVGSQAQQGGAWVHFAKPTKGNHIFARVGVSFISSAQACSNAETQIPNFETAFATVRQAATQAWTDKLSVITVDTEGASDLMLENFWSGVYRAMISPQDYTGENPLWTSTEPYFDSYYCIWDSFRASHPLLTILDPVQQTRMVQSLIDIYVHTGYLPDCRMQLSPGYTQGGSNAEVVLTDSYLKSIGNLNSSAGSVDWPTAFAGMVHDAEVEPYQWLTAGRGHLATYKSLGYIAIDGPDPGYGLSGASISRTVEYAYDDYCIAAMAKVMGNATALKTYKARAGNWKNMYNLNQTSFLNGVNTDFVGFLQPRYENGSYAFQDPTRGSPVNDANCCGPFYEDLETYEGSCWSYGFYAPGDMAALVKLLGGGADFVEKLDYMHDNSIIDIGDEQVFLTVYQYHYGGRPGRSSYRAHYYIPTDFNDTINGIPGNDDGGAMGAFETWSLMGLFPVPGQNVYLISSPFFASVSVQNTITGNTATIRSTNFDPSYAAIYIQSATLNGAAYTKNWLDHSFFLDGGVLELTLGTSESSTWGTAKADLPPSLSTTGIYVGGGGAGAG